MIRLTQCSNLQCVSHEKHLKINDKDNFCVYCGVENVKVKHYHFSWKREGVGLIGIVIILLIIMYKTNIQVPGTSMMSEALETPTPSEVRLTPTQTRIPTKTITPIPPPTATATFVPESSVLFSLNFEDNDVGPWDNRSSIPLTLLDESGNTYLHFKAAGIPYPGIWYTDVSNQWVNYAYESKVRLYKNGVIFCFYENGGSHYQAGLDLPGSVFFSDYVNTRSDQPYVSIKSTEFLTKTNQWYLVRVEVIENQLKMFVDGKLVLSATRDTIPYGGIGIITGGDGNGNGEFDVDDIRVWSLN